MVKMYWSLRFRWVLLRLCFMSVPWRLQLRWVTCRFASGEFQGNLALCEFPGNLLTQVSNLEILLRWVPWKLLMWLSLLSLRWVPGRPCHRKVPTDPAHLRSLEISSQLSSLETLPAVLVSMSTAFVSLGPKPLWVRASFRSHVRRCSATEGQVFFFSGYLCFR